MAKILLVDDSRVVNKIVSDSLSQAGHDVLRCYSVDEAIKTLTANQNDIQAIITDIIMPGKDGIELVDYVHMNYAPVKRPKIMVISGGSQGTVSAETAVMAVRDKVEQVLIKPFGYDQLMEKVKALLAG